MLLALYLKEIENERNDFMVAKRVCAGLVAIAIVTGIIGTLIGETLKDDNNPYVMTVHAIDGYEMDYDSPYPFVADYLQYGAFTVASPYKSNTDYLESDTSYEWTWKETAREISNDPNQIALAGEWGMAEEVLNVDLVGIANWQKDMYVQLLLDYMIYSESTDAFEDEYNSNVAKFMDAIYNNIRDNASDDTVEEFLKSMTMDDAAKIASDTCDQFDVFDLADYLDGIKTVSEDVGDYFERVSNLETLAHINNQRIKFLQTLKVMSDDEYLDEAIDYLVVNYEAANDENLAKLLNAESVEFGSMFAREVSSQVGNVALTALVDLCPQAAAVIGGIKLGKAGIDFFFNTQDIATTTVKMSIIWQVHLYMKETYEFIRNQYTYLSGDSDKAYAMLNAYDMYLDLNLYANEICKEYATALYQDGLWNSWDLDHQGSNYSTFETRFGLDKMLIQERKDIVKSGFEKYDELYNSAVDLTVFDISEDDNKEDIHIDDPVIPSETFKVEDDGMSNEYLRLISYSNGWFRLNTTEGDPALSSDNDKLLLYHKDTSYSTIVIDGAVNKFGEAGIEEPVYDFGNESQTIVATYGDITVKQILTFANNASTNRRDVLEIKYVVTNNGTESHKIGTRIMLDTMLGDNDDAPFRVPGTGNLTTEKEYSGSSIPQYWQAFDSLTNPTVISQGSFLRGNENQPDKVQFTNWRRVKNTPWNYEVSEGSSNGDSAVSVIWNEKDLAAGETRTYSTYYGLSELTQDVAPPLALSMYCDSTANYDPTTGNYMPVDVTAYIENIGNGDAKNAYLRIELPDEMELADSEGGADEGVDVEFFDNLYVGNIESRTWKIKILNSIKPNTTYPITIVCGADGVEEKKVTRYITISKATITPKDNRIDWGNDNGTGKFPGVDNLAFTNSPFNFFDENVGYTINSDGTLDQIKGKYTLDKPVFNFLTDGMSNTVWKNMYDYQNSTWGGSCYGMSTVVSLMKAGYLTPDKWTNSATNAHGLDKPKDNHMTMSLINFYQTSFQLPDLQDIYYNYVVTH